jgi:hypothetical protein
MRWLRLVVTPFLVLPVTVSSIAFAQEKPDEATSAAAREVRAPDDLEQLVEWMAGSFSTAAQAADDPAFLDIRLHMVPIWTDRTDGHWLYVEQAVASSQDDPYRQRVYRVTEPTDGLFQSEVFTIPDPERFAGAWRSDDPLAELGPDGLVPRRGCEILMRRRGDRFLGSTLDTLCPSDLHGAEHATSEVEISRWGLISWDRGWSADGEQVWGATEGGYVFDHVDSAGAESTASDQEEGADGPADTSPGDGATDPMPDEEPPASD